MKKRHRVLMVDDDDALLFAFGRTLRDPDYEIDTANSVQNAMELIDNNTYDVVISDLQLGYKDELGGMDIVRYLKARSPETCTVLLTGFDSQDALEKRFGVKPDYFLLKPVRAERIREILRATAVPGGQAEQ